MVRVAVGMMAAVALLAGCASDGDGSADPSCGVAEDAGFRMAPSMDHGASIMGAVEAGRTWEGIVLVDDPATRPAFTWVHGADFRLAPVDGNGTGLWLMQADASDPAVTPSAMVGVWMPGCSEVQRDRQVWLYAPQDPGPAVQPGQGAMVYTAGFWTNGTLFYTNDPAIDASDWPRASWYAWEGGDPLPVYVYGSDRSEQPAHWKGLAQNYGAPGSPADPAAQGAAGSVDTALGAGYFTTIRGFNEGLKGLTTTSTTVVLIAPEDAYTRPGYEDHPLYGDSLVFIQRVVEVHAQPCLREPPFDAACR